MGPTKTLDSVTHSIILERTSRSKKFPSHSYLSTLHRKSKAKASKHQKSLCSSRLKTSHPAHSSYSSSSSNRITTSLSLVDGEKSIIALNLAVSTFIPLMIFYLSALKLFYRPFDKGKQNLHIFISKTSSSRSNLLCFILNVFKLHAFYDLLNQQCKIFNFKFKPVSLAQDLQSHSNMIELALTCSTTIASRSEFATASFSELFLVMSFLVNGE